MTKTVIIADDHPFTVEGMEALISSIGGLKVIGTADNGIKTIALVKKLKPDIALLDMSMPGMNGLEVFQEAKRMSPKTKFIVITGVSAGVIFKQLYEAGIDGLFIKNSSLKKISNGIEKIAQGQRIISHAAMEIIKTAEDKKDLTKREIDVLKQLVRGLNNREIADILGVSPKTVDSHRMSLLRKLNVNTTAALLVSAIRLGLIDI